MSLNQGKIMNTHKRARKEPTTDKAEPHHQPTFEQIQVRAYEIYVQRGRTDGLDLDDWLQAENELKTSSQNRSRGNQADRTSARVRGKHGNRNR